VVQDDACRASPLIETMETNHPESPSSGGLINQEMKSFIVPASLSLVVAALATGSTRDGKSRPTPLVDLHGPSQAAKLASSTDSIPYTTLSHSQSSGFHGKLTATFDNEEDFAEFWAKHESNR